MAWWGNYGHSKEIVFLFNINIWLVIRKLNIYDRIMQEPLICLCKTIVLRFLKKKSQSCCMFYGCPIWGSQDQENKAESRSTQTFTSKTYFEKYLCHLSLNTSLIHESVDRILHKEMLFLYIFRIIGQFVNKLLFSRHSEAILVGQIAPVPKDIGLCT